MSTFMTKVIGLIASDVHKTKWKPGDVAPEFSGKDQDGNNVALKDFRGKKVVLYFYPKDNTMGCTAEACNLRDNYNYMLKAGFVVIGVSADDEESHRGFKEKYNLPFPLLADTDLSIAKTYDVWGEKKFIGKTYTGMTRTTFIIDENGVISEVITDVDSFDHAKQIMR